MSAAETRTAGFGRTLPQAPPKANRPSDGRQPARYEGSRVGLILVPCFEFPGQAVIHLQPFRALALIQENSDNRYYRALFDELRRLRHVEGQNLTIERYAKEQNTAGPAALVAEVVRNNPDVVYVVGPGALEFKVQTAIIPIVGLTGDPLALGLVQSLAHPGGNVTGVSVDTGPSIHGSGSNCCAHRNQASAPTHRTDSTFCRPSSAAHRSAGVAPSVPVGVPEEPSQLPSVLQ